MKYNTNWVRAKSINAKRLINEPVRKYRDNFQKDRDRILYSKAFRRLSGKTQIFLSGQNDHLRTRLTHSLEVNQVAKTIASALNLNLDLTEAIALGHDIGHTPFGHIGERTLNFIMNGCETIKDFNSELPNDKKGFKHNVQALRILKELEKNKENVNGLNITNYTLWGIVNHTKTKNIKCKRYTFDSDKENAKIVCYFNHIEEECNQEGLLLLDFYNTYIEQYNDNTDWTVEALIVRIADEIAQRHHDIEDGIFANLINKDDIIDIIEENFYDFFNKENKKDFNKIKNLTDLTLLSSYVSRFIVNFLITKVINSSKNNIKLLFDKYNKSGTSDFLSKKAEIYANENIYNIINYPSELIKKDNNLQQFLKTKILNSYIAQKMDGKAEFIIRKLFEAFVSNPQQLPDRTLLYFFTNFLGEDYTKEKGIGALRTELKNNFERNNNPAYKHALLRTICDYISGMTDNYAYNQYEILYGSTRITN